MIGPGLLELRQRYPADEAELLAEWSRLKIVKKGVDNSFKPFPGSHVQNIAQQLFQNIAYIHSLNLTHADLKLENILLVNPAFRVQFFQHRVLSTDGVPYHVRGRRRELCDTQIRLVDFGMATFGDEYHHPEVTTPAFRAPEVVLHLGWSFPCDIWSIGCILFELCTGKPAFNPRSSIEHLVAMEHVLGRPIDSHLIEKAKQSSNLPDNLSRYIRGYMPIPPTAMSRVTKTEMLGHLIPNETMFDQLFLDLLQQIFVFDPNRRITAHEALRHPWVTGEGAYTCAKEQERTADSERNHILGVPTKQLSQGINTKPMSIQRKPPLIPHLHNRLPEGDINRILEIISLVLVSNYRRTSICYKNRKSFILRHRDRLRSHFNKQRDLPTLPQHLHAANTGGFCNNDNIVKITGE
ncbi:hypothetical protein EYZ11_012354 [Aspergillus tanneri]|uniref:Protein kinase domain-containing protein n=1 Tax=Aspergillus tanneri TaxID=1220188 RepID=A0A4S3J0F6_9EURO|nr:hypothetical protein EYZ11_012354 [Aspergillus tanneri]